MESSDSRKRPLDGDPESGVTKRSNQGAPTAGNDDGQVQVKVLIPSIAAGAIIGKGGDTISQIQKDSGANIKMSKANDFYPGTTERVCLISGHIDAVKQVHEFIMDKIREKPDPNPKPVEGESKINFERHKQVKLLVPNSTAGMIIGKAGNFIRQIKEESGAYVQISQKSKEMSLPERCVTIAGDLDQNKMAIDMVFAKILEDPLSASCPNISYIDFKGPVASSNPTGSPFAGPPGHPGHHRMEMGGGGHGGVFGNIGNSMNNLNLNSGANNGGMGAHNGGPVETLKSTLRGSGYSEQAVEEISHAMYTLANYGFLGLGLGLGGLNIGGGGLGGGGLGGNLTLANLAGILAGNPPHQQAGPPQNNSLLGSGGGGGGGGGSGPNSGGGSAGGGAGVANGDTKSSVFGPVGSTTTTMAGGDTGEGSGSYFGSPSMNGGEQFSGAGGDSMFGNSFNNGNGAGFQGGNNGFTGQNQNSFGLGTGMGSFPSGGMNNGGGEIEKKDVDVGEHIVGAILGPGGRGIVELQKLTGANIQISKKGVYSPGTRNRIVTLNGNSTAIQRAQYMIQQRIAQEEAKRAQNRSQQQPQPPH